ncbi:DUF21 domain-containing protein [Haloarcula nitratireducens]|uniref:DUF21 domain-containing protein n=1 Tax=Haloarcula nitratireducens TaxID=2487749 RepID=A0AAW4P8E0_9EURY|nr:DUF21 domain-containing protein [Halomicroarcula nitratireducens]MBX0294195.1 DUF21 domain-containing protein [Halomicroarcula nitratireducens]
MSTPVLPTLAAVVVLLCCSAFFSSSETALFSLSREWLAAAATTDPRAAAAEDVLADPHRLLVTILVGNNVVNIALSSLLTAVFVERFQSGIAVVLTTLLATSVVLVAGEIVPKSYGLGHAQTFALRVVTPLRYVELLLYPVVTVFDAFTRWISTRIGGQQTIEETYDEVDGPADATDAKRR